MIQAIFFVVVFAALQILVPFLVQQLYQLISGAEAASNTTMLIISMTASSVACLALFLTLKWAEVSRSYVRSRPWAVLFWCAIAALGAAIPSTWLQEQLPELPNLVEEEFDLLLRHRWGYFAIGILAPVAEELAFRGAVLRALLSWGKNHWVMIALSAAIFALIHGNPAQMPHAFLVGLMLGWMYWRTGSIIPGVAFHWVNNSVAYVMYNLYPTPSLKLVDLFRDNLHVLAAVAFSLLILLPALYQLNLRMKRE
jgi:membrane protease YdiL (CAAX protease family)